MNPAYHRPVLLQESIEGLSIREGGIFVDATFGGGGHAAEIIKHIGATGRLIGFDQDADALQNILNDLRITIQPHNFRYLKQYLRLEGIRSVDGILADLGVSSYQFDTADRGFSYRFDGPLDMRMDQNNDLTAAKIVNEYDTGTLQSVFSQYGEVRNSKTLAETIVNARRQSPILTINHLLDILGPMIRGDRNRYLAQVFQALRIEVNDEMTALEEFLMSALDVLKVGGRLVVISYHSLEDRLVKNILKSGNVEGKIIKDFYGNIHRPMKVLTKKPITASPSELALNPRARSAKLRIGEKLDATKK